MSGDLQIGIIGGGMAGLACATGLAQRGIASTVFDKGRGPGGRMATRRISVGNREISFDHGAQYFTARHPAFLAVCRTWHAEGIIAPWPAAGREAWVGVPGMNAPLRHMAAGLDVRWGTRVDSISRADGQWRVHTADRTHNSDRLVAAVPAEQAAVLLADTETEIARRAAAVCSDPCWTVMALFGEPIDIPVDIVRDDGAPIPWAARNGAKPGRDGAESWVIQGSPRYSSEVLERTPEDICSMMLAQFFDQVGIAPVEPVHCTAHRWRYARVPSVAEPVTGQDLGDIAIWNGEFGLGAAGDWLAGPRVENAFLSGRALAECIAQDVSSRSMEPQD
ncbi:NAD(P)/FAD-dependent oxidoreductase [Allopontixanthobacter sp.]|uniref:NAD(P)/FAD-dependent oxidoreductase n=1 Tax=Allopontixanthobacter sp. TaxID=2906452 RepID=UPI002ABCF848|nr:FAD-dependent oxidoreductase [Allopontixanthobacter sp.]MDZ4307905.1 NAD(P)-binding protein [Allopontixanthobacter sp.]